MAELFVEKNLFEAFAEETIPDAFLKKLKIHQQTCLKKKLLRTNCQDPRVNRDKANAGKTLLLS